MVFSTRFAVDFDFDGTVNHSALFGFRSRAILFVKMSHLNLIFDNHLLKYRIMNKIYIN